MGALRLHAVKAELRQRMHKPVSEQGAWVRSVVRGYFAYHAGLGRPTGHHGAVFAPNARGCGSEPFAVEVSVPDSPGIA
jgi:hypothetical protein